MLLPTCPGVEVESVVVTPLVGDDFDLDESHAWRATGYHGPVAGGVLLEASEWRTAAGASPDWGGAFGIDLVVGGQNLGTVVYAEELSSVASSPGEFLVEDGTMTKEEFLDAFQPNDCPSRGAA
ncbi:hypothetical protein H9657_15365 [Cellulomonas sp. Sa3CUA2]|uniref:Uncharacterized protein n=1 Tax=Cellulomonas avistercoris TaxID=2762242 RepID=A0ABR8QGV0_9CELL|nr:hypothetical protein [Cellulomonas avistercoris]MBD7919648.1 hypothetical protein [Cellulomonas avistercoris]